MGKISNQTVVVILASFVGACAACLFQLDRLAYGNTESAAMEALRKMYRSWDNFVILEIE